jgi:thioesterase domain-containing protein
VQPAGPYRLGGWSFGALVAVEMAGQLEAQGEAVAELALVDPSAILAARPQQPLDDVSALALLAHDLGGLAGQPFAVTAGELAELDEAGRLDFLLARAVAAGTLPANTDAAQLRRLARLVTAHLQAAYAYAPRRVSSPIRILLPAERPAESLGAWREVAAGGLALHRLPGDHYSLLREPQVGRLAKILLGGEAATSEEICE